MADDREPPPLFDNVNLDKKSDDVEDLFASAIDTQPSMMDPLSVNSPPPLLDVDLSAPLQSEPEAEPEPEPPSSTPAEVPNEPSSGTVAAAEHPQLVPDTPVEEEVPLDRGDRDDEEEDIFAEAESAARQQHQQVPHSQQASGGEPPAHFSNRMHRVTSAELEQHGAASDDQYVRITITEPQKIGEGMGAYVAYRVITNTNMQLYRKRQFTVLRRFSDFLGLHDKLAEKYLRTGRIVPPAPEKSVIGSTKIKMTNQADQGSSAEFVERRRASLERYLNRTATHPILRVDPDFREFLEADSELPRATSTSALSGAGVMRLFNKVGETVNKITYKMDESDPWFEEKVQQIDSLDNQMRRLLTNTECLVEQRRELASSTAAFAKTAAMLSNCEEHNALSRALAQLAEVEERVESLYSDQSNADFAIFCELIKDYVALIGAVKDVFHERVKVYQNWQHSQMMLNKKREAKAKLEIMGRTEKLGQARDEVIEWESKVERGQEEFDKISKMIKKEMERFDVVRVKDFKAVVIKYIESLMNNQMRLIQYWEAFLPEAKAIA